MINEGRCLSTGIDGQMQKPVKVLALQRKTPFPFEWPGRGSAEGWISSKFVGCGERNQDLLGFLLHALHFLH